MYKPSSLFIKLIITGVALILSCLLWAAGSFESFDLFLYDQGLKHRVDKNPRSLNPSILKIDLNDSSESALGDALDTREPFGDILSILGKYGAGAGLDFVFPRFKQGDGSMIKAAEYFNTLVYAVIPVLEGEFAFAPSIDETNQKILRNHLWHIKGNTEKLPKALSFIMSNPPISASATMLGHIGVSPDTDGIYRRTSVLCKWEDGVIPSLPLAMAASAMGIDPSDIELAPGKGLVIPLGEEDEPLVIPCDDKGYLLVPYGARWETDLYRYSFTDLINAENSGEIDLFSEIFGTMAVVADITTATRDFGITPFETSFPLSGIHASILSGILDEFFYMESKLTFKIIFIFIIFIFIILLCALDKDLIYHIGFAFLFSCLCFFVFALWNWGNRLPWLGVPAFLVFSSWASGFLLRLFIRYREQLLYKTALSRYFPRALAARIASEGKTELVPAYKELTILFSDISGFTKWSSDKSPEAVHNFLSDYLESMAEILFSYGGTVDKFMGDGILAFFGDPLDLPDHPERCINAAIAMQKKIGELAEKWKHIVDIDLKVRVGINTGKVIVGNLGTKTRIEYTVIGSAVNLAQRMESNAPIGGILVTETVKEKTRDKFSFSDRRDIKVKGYDEPVYAYEVIGNR